MKSSKIAFWLSALIPVGLLIALLVVFWRTSGGLRFTAPAPVENIAFEQIVFREDEIVAHVRNVGPEAVTIAQVQVGWLNRASWEFTVEPAPTIERLRTARVRIPYPWTEGEPYEIVLFTANGLPFAHEVAVATATPVLNAENLLVFSMLGVYVGVIPVFLGILWLPFLRQLGQQAMGFLLSLTIGLLIFLGVDAVHDALETGAELPGPFQGVMLTVIGVAGSLLGLSALTRAVEARQQQAGGDLSLTLAYLVAFSIGMHNLGEGLAIGGAYALGEIATGALFIIGFMIHNLTEGVAIVAPIARTGFGSARGGRSWMHLVWLGAVAGVPTIFGSALGAFALSPVYAVLFLAVGAGAVFQVVLEILRQMIRSAAPEQESASGMVSPANLVGFLAGLGVMYITGLLLPA
jgi:zinc transporter ZupT